MKKKPVITERFYRISDHRMSGVRMIEDNDKLSFEIEQVTSDDILPEVNNPGEEIKIEGSSMKVCVTVREFSSIISAGIDFFKQHYKA